jgi:hypothetical protein
MNINSKFFLQFDLNDRNVDLIDDALGGFNIENCKDACLPSAQNTSNLNDSLRPSETPVNINLASQNKKNKYAFDVVDDSNDQHLDNFNFTEKEDNGNLLEDDSAHKRIVRVSIQKPPRKNQGACFKGNESYALYDMQKIMISSEDYENNINIRFKTSSANGLIFLIFQKFPNQLENYLSLSVEDG